jgi:hypothetical protein
VEVEVHELAGPLVLRDCREVLVEEELQAKVIGLDDERSPLLAQWVPVALRLKKATGPPP